MIAIDVRNVCLKPLLDHVGFYVEAGAFVWIVGESGSGKTALIHCMMGSETPDSGMIFYAPGVHPASMGYMQQHYEEHSTNTRMVKDVVLGGIKEKKRGLVFLSGADKQKAKWAMEKLDITSLQTRRFSDLSGGQRQRVLLAKTLCASDSLLILDEPDAGLDAASSSALFQTLQELHRDGMTIILATRHIPEEISMATHVLLLHNRVRFFGPVTCLPLASFGAEE